MKRFTILALLAFALAAVPAALADGGASPAAPTVTRARQAGDGNARIRVEILRLRLQIVALRFRLHCAKAGNASQERCTAFVRKAVDRLTRLDANVQAKLDALKACTPDGADAKCKNADKKIAVLTPVDEHVRKAIQRLQDWLVGKTPPGDPSSDSALDQAAGQLGQAAGSNG